tara:strand:+ start:249 stop:434 length:186 start_codon:yes stop_codon:yes gene_type:complete
MTNTNGYTNKEMLALIMEEISDLNERIDFLHEKINKTPTRAEIVGWLVGLSSTAAFLNTIM